MPVVKRTMLVPYSQQQMYDLVNNVEDYRQFVPACEKSQILSRDQDKLRATLTFTRSGVSKSFTTLNLLQPQKMIEIRLVDGPFQQLEGFWRFEPKTTGSQVSLDLEFEFSNKLLAMMFGPVFHQVTSTLVDVFYKRAQEVYKNDSD